MINLLPISGIKRIISEYRIRLVNTAPVLLAAIILIATTLLFPAYLLASHKRTIILEDLSKTGDRAVSSQETKELEKIIKEMDATLDMLSSKGQSLSISDLVKDRNIDFTVMIKLKGDKPETVQKTPPQNDESR